MITVDIIRQIEQAQMRKDLPDFGPGDTVRVFFKVVKADGKGSSPLTAL